MAARIRSITLDELLALNDELRAIARTGIPLEHGLKVIGEDLPGRLGRLVKLISERLERGEPLAAILEDPNLSLPRAYCAIVAAGVRAGRLPSALESLTKSVQRAVELRRTLVISLIYPVILLLVATLLFVLTWQYLFPSLQRSVMKLVEHDLPQWFEFLGWTTVHGYWWLAAIWILAVVVIGIWFVRSQASLQFATGWRRWPSIGSVRAAGHAASFAETMAMLVEQRVPAVEALQLAGAASGDARLRAAADELAERVRSGRMSGPAPGAIPPLLSWLIMTTGSPSQLARTLRQTAAAQREYAIRVSLMLGTYLPVLFSAMVGSVLVLYYALLVMGPFFYLLYELGQP